MLLDGDGFSGETIFLGQVKSYNSIYLLDEKQEIILRQQKPHQNNLRDKGIRHPLTKGRVTKTPTPKSNTIGVTKPTPL